MFTPSLAFSASSRMKQSGRADEGHRRALDRTVVVQSLEEASGATRLGPRALGELEPSRRRITVHRQRMAEHLGT